MDTAVAPANRYSYPNESAAIEALEAALREQFSPKDLRKIKKSRGTGFDASQFNTANQPDQSGQLKPLESNL